MAAEALAARLVLTRKPVEPLPFMVGLADANAWLRNVRLACVNPPPEAGKAAEWLLDNDYFVDRALKQIRKDMPPGFYSQLPALANEPNLPPRVFIVAHEILCATKLQLSLGNVVRFVQVFQRQYPLSIAELWALPTMLRIACIEILISSLTPLLEGAVKQPFAVSPYAAPEHSLDATERVSRSLGNLNVIASIPWKEFFDRTSLVEEVLSQDPDRCYACMDFETRDQYRRAVEEIARLSGQEESAVAAAAVRRSSAVRAEDVAHHVGYWLIDEGRWRLEEDLGAVPSRRTRMVRAIFAHPGLFYLAMLVLAGIGAAILPALYLAHVGAGLDGWIAGLLLSQLPASVLALSVVHWILTRSLRPQVLPKLDCENGLPANSATIVTVPVVISDTEEVARLAERLEAHWLANRDPLLQIALLADLADAPSQTMPGDEEIERALQNAVGRLNHRYGSGHRGPFHLLQRPRLHNPAQGCWMAWERKRGKLEQFNKLLVEGDWSGFSHHTGDRKSLSRIRFVVTVDADTILPPGSVGKMVGTLAHPLNHARIDPVSARVTGGYTIIQPRVEISPSSGERTLFARLFTGETAIDIYSRAVSDVYQDLFGSGIFVGKGIYDLRAFHAVIDGRVPENRILSHDLFEGAHGRAALATDIVLYENFPTNYSEYTRRLHRWIRGDWQLLAWLWPHVPGPNGTRLRSRIAGIDRWKMIDNLRRSLVPPSLVALALAGWFVLPGHPAFWTALVILAPAGQLFTDLVSGFAHGRRAGAAYGFWYRMSDQAGRWLLVLIYLLHEAMLSLHAIMITLWRSLVSHRNLLEWTSAAHVARGLQDRNSRAAIWQAMWPASVIALGIALLLLALRPAAFAEAAVLLIAWIAAPEITHWICRPRMRGSEPLGAGDAAFLRQLARKTWYYFETFAGPEDNWLPPDNYQTAPHEEIAHRTSPTNIGMLLLSIATAWDLGYLGRRELVARTASLFETMRRLDRYRGHFLNWYETRHLAPLEPRYVSSVDSGNLALALVAYGETLREAAARDSFEIQRWDGLDDLLALLGSACEGLAGDGAVAEILAAIRSHIAELPQAEPARQMAGLKWLRDKAIADLEDESQALLENASGEIPQGALDLPAWLERLRHHVRDMIRDLSGSSDHRAELMRLAAEAAGFAGAMDFTWLFDPERQLLHIGHNVSTGRIDTHYYDLLASEARLASYFAIAKGELPVEHWFHLQRPITRAKRGISLVSWNGSMFEYLMPRLLLPGHGDTLLGESERVAVDIQRRYGKAKSVPWGISESAFASRDPEHRFRYQAFGVPHLGMRRGLSRDLVIAPYASALALAIIPREATDNLRRLCDMGASGRFGLWEAIDFTADRKPDDGAFAPVSAFMAHHQGMILSAIGNVLLQDRMVHRLERDPQIKLVSLLLSERIPHELPSEIERLDAIEAAEVASSAPSRIDAVWEPADTHFPQVHLLGNGRLSSWISEGGGGGLQWHHQALTRFVPDAVRDADGCWLYLHDRDSQQDWSATRQPTGAIGDEYRVLFQPHMAEFHRRDHGIETRLEVAVGAGDDFEIRRLTIVNESSRPRRLMLTSYAEIVLAPPLEDERHPAFSKLFVGGEFLPERGGLLFSRRPKGPADAPPVLLHALIGADGPVPSLRYECDRLRFIGRGRSTRNPLGASLELNGPQDRDAARGWTLDPVAALQLAVDLAPGESRQYCFLTIAAATRAAALAIAERHATLSSIDWLLNDAARDAGRAIQRARIEPADLPAIQSLGSLLVHPGGGLRAAPETIRANRLGQTGLWGLALSGDLPIVLLRAQSGSESLIALLARAHKLWRRLGLEVDVVLLQTAGSAYIEPIRSEVGELLREIGASEMLGRRGGIHLVFGDQIGPDQIRLVESMAWVILDDAKGSLADQLAAIRWPVALPPPILPSLLERPDGSHHAISAPEDLLFGNGLGGFIPDGREYVITLQPGQTTPAPWSNVLANDEFGTLVTEAGGGFSWAINSGEHRLTPWTNDPVADRSGEALYLRDEETAAVWTVTPAPAGQDCACQIRHGQGYSTWRKTCHGLDQEMRIFVPVDAPVKLIRLRLRNRGTRERRITATYYCEWLLGSLPSIARRHVRCEFDQPAQTILATSPWNAEFAGRAAFLTASLDAHGFTTNREEFLGRERSDAAPAGLERWGLSGAQTAGHDACGAYQVHLDIAAGQEIEFAFVLGEGADRAQAIELAAQWRSMEAVSAAQDRLCSHWDNLLGTVTVHTPDAALDLMVNRWLIYQSLSSRIMARAGFYQASGAIGYRDQLQDMLALLHVDPARVRAHILACAAHQFEQGDVLHWWHPPADRGVRTRCSDDMLWLPFATGTYVRATGDISILEERVPFLVASPLAEHEEDRYDRFDQSPLAYSLIDHCERALDRVTLGVEGLPLIGTGDWNDGMDRVGRAGRGESVWLAWFASVAAEHLADLERRLGRKAEADHWADRAELLRHNGDQAGWDGEWYRRAYDDHGNTLGSKDNAECRIDSISQSWALFAGAPAERVEMALAAARRELIDGEGGLARLLWPPFDRTPRDPGYIKAYPPGIRENGGQYSHAAAWLGLALAQSGDGDGAHRVFSMINPVARSASTDAAELYRIEPYAVAGDIASAPPHTGRGGWSWYTGAASWSWRLAVEGLLGITLQEGRLRIAPSLPRDWHGYEATLRRGDTSIQLKVERHAEAADGYRLLVDGQVIEGNEISLPAGSQVDDTASGEQARTR
ncbi:GH36-type glycosyl hydrolase domain-containing protein [Alteraurantiacibacter aestuarii]|uniref:GH36-type glycosyl hydrolase domain-containing protein n=1 Tax=Alteraurantiacibacter aestuarii TaxID=650004 RepID=UPI0031E1AC2E